MTNTAASASGTDEATPVEQANMEVPSSTAESVATAEQPQELPSASSAPSTPAKSKKFAGTGDTEPVQLKDDYPVPEQPSALPQSIIEQMSKETQDSKNQSISSSRQCSLEPDQAGAAAQSSTEVKVFPKGEATATEHVSGITSQENTYTRNRRQQMDFENLKQKLNQLTGPKTEKDGSVAGPVVSSMPSTPVIQQPQGSSAGSVGSSGYYASGASVMNAAGEGILSSIQPPINLQAGGTTVFSTGLNQPGVVSTSLTSQPYSSSQHLARGSTPYMFHSSASAFLSTAVSGSMGGIQAPGVLHPGVTGLDVNPGTLPIPPSSLPLPNILNLPTTESVIAPGQQPLQQQPGINQIPSGLANQGLLPGLAQTGGMLDPQGLFGTGLQPALLQGQGLGLQPNMYGVGPQASSLLTGQPPQLLGPMANTSHQLSLLQQYLGLLASQNPLQAALLQQLLQTQQHTVQMGQSPFANQSAALIQQQLSPQQQLIAQLVSVSGLLPLLFGPQQGGSAPLHYPYTTNLYPPMLQPGAQNLSLPASSGSGHAVDLSGKYSPPTALLSQPPAPVIGEHLLAPRLRRPVPTHNIHELEKELIARLHTGATPAASRRGMLFQTQHSFQDHYSGVLPPPVSSQIHAVPVSSTISPQLPMFTGHAQPMSATQVPQPIPGIVPIQTPHPIIVKPKSDEDLPKPDKGNTGSLGGEAPVSTVSEGKAAADPKPDKKIENEGLAGTTAPEQAGIDVTNTPVLPKAENLSSKHVQAKKKKSRFSVEIVKDDPLLSPRSEENKSLTDQLEHQGGGTEPGTAQDPERGSDTVGERMEPEGSAKPSADSNVTKQEDPSSISPDTSATPRTHYQRQTSQRKGRFQVLTVQDDVSSGTSSPSVEQELALSNEMRMRHASSSSQKESSLKDVDVKEEPSAQTVSTISEPSSAVSPPAEGVHAGSVVPMVDITKANSAVTPQRGDPNQPGVMEVDAPAKSSQPPTLPPGTSASTTTTAAPSSSIACVSTNPGIGPWLYTTTNPPQTGLPAFATGTPVDPLTSSISEINRGVKMGRLNVLTTGGLPAIQEVSPAVSPVKIGSREVLIRPTNLMTSGSVLPNLPLPQLVSMVAPPNPSVPAIPGVVAGEQPHFWVETVDCLGSDTTDASCSSPNSQVDTLDSSGSGPKIRDLVGITALDCNLESRGRSRGEKVGRTKRRSRTEPLLSSATFPPGATELPSISNTVSGDAAAASELNNSSGPRARNLTQTSRPIDLSNNHYKQSLPDPTPGGSTQRRGSLKRSLTCPASLTPHPTTAPPPCSYCKHPTFQGLPQQGWSGRAGSRPVACGTPQMLLARSPDIASAVVGCIFT